MNGNLCDGALGRQLDDNKSKKLRKMCMNLVASIIPAPKHFTIMQRLHSRPRVRTEQMTSGNMLVTRIEAMAMNFRCRACDLLKQLLWDSMPHSSLAINASGVVGNSTSRQAPHHPFYLHLHPISCNSR